MTQTSGLLRLFNRKSTLLGETPKTARPELLAEFLPRIDGDAAGKFPDNGILADDNGLPDLLVLHQRWNTLDVSLVHASRGFELDSQIQVTDHEVHFQSGAGSPIGQRAELLVVSQIGADLFNQKVFEGAAELLGLLLNQTHSG